MKKTVVVFVVMLVLLFQNGMDVEAKRVTITKVERLKTINMKLMNLLIRI